MSEKIDTIQGRRDITEKIDVLTTHLRKTHKLFIRRYVSSLYSLIGLFIGTFLGICIGYFPWKFQILYSGNFCIWTFYWNYCRWNKRKKFKK